MERGRIQGLDVLRGAAAVAVMLHHHGQYYDVLYPGRSPLAVDLGPGHFGVELFFIISGFVILMTVERRATVREFVVSRAIRLLPAFLAALAMASILLMLRPMHPLEPPTLGEFLANLTMAPSLFGVREVDLPYWTLTYELVFYALMAMVLGFGLLRRIEWLGLLAVVAGLAFLLLSDEQSHRRISILLLVRYSNFFLIGICLYRLRTGAARPVTYVALAVALLVTALGGAERSFHAPGWIYFLLAVAFTTLVWFASGRPGRWIATPPLLFLGRISYPLYLVHVAAGFQLIRMMTERGWSTLASTVAAGLLSLAAATAIHYLYERPMQRWLRSYTRTMAPPAQAF